MDVLTQHVLKNYIQTKTGSSSGSQFEIFHISAMNFLMLPSKSLRQHISNKESKKLFTYVLLNFT